MANSSSSRANSMIMEERQELMIPFPPMSGQSLFRTAHFLRPTADAAGGSAFAPIITPPDRSGDRKQRIGASFLGWNNPLRNWRIWLEEMHSLHHWTWKAAGIYEAIMNSACKIHKNEEMIFDFAEKWCPDTNTFVFPWGEATVTLEDVMILGGFSVWGESILLPPVGEEMRRISNCLHAERKSIIRTSLKKASQSAWMARFMHSGSHIEHEAFLAYWLARFVFPKFAKDSVGDSMVSIAIHLSRGTRMALAPAVLASIYQDLRLLKEALLISSTSCRLAGNSLAGFFKVKLSSPLQLLHIWIWERFPCLKPRPNPTGSNDPQFAKWDSLQFEVENVSECINSAEGSFIWRPYSRSTMENPALRQGRMALIRCLRTSELIGPDGDYVEQYLPNRVAMQFGVDQDIPGFVPRLISSQENVWRHYNRPVGDENILVPARLFEANVTTRYLIWWRKLNTGQDAGNRPVRDDIDLILPIIRRKPYRRSRGSYFGAPIDATPLSCRREQTMINVGDLLAIVSVGESGRMEGESDESASDDDEMGREIGTETLPEDIAGFEAKLRHLEEKIGLYKDGESMA